ncbi:DUF808 domain-containing protein [Flocculibacter collagenilyticus]|uniref:DUF808 domain-containing protein n=1 Tax=Flocculibacter collagenilyticus TaxID=2744479 RepID=UPI0018F340AF|nr:DUF808 domain-containing protein [Flocculibacter collagenilyticus]
MAATSLLALIDDIATVLDDVAILSKVAAKKTAGVLGDDLALNAQQVSGVKAERELPVVWAVAKGSFLNKLILVPAALLISYFANWLTMPLLMLGGAYLCYEGVEKLHHSFFADKEEAEKEHEEMLNALADDSVDLVELEKEKIKGAIRTDFILSAEIIVIALSTVANTSLAMQASVISTIAILMTIGVYSLVAGIVKLDDAGLYLVKSAEQTSRFSQFKKIVGRGLLGFAPILMKTLSVVGTAAMFLVGGGILTHGLAFAHHWSEALIELVATFPGGDFYASWLTPLLFNLVGGILVGTLILLMVLGVKQLKPAKAETSK